MIRVFSLAFFLLSLLQSGPAWSSDAPLQEPAFLEFAQNYTSRSLSVHAAGDQYLIRLGDKYAISAMQFANLLRDPAAAKVIRVQKYGKTAGGVILALLGTGTTISGALVTALGVGLASSFGGGGALTVIVLGLGTTGLGVAGIYGGVKLIKHRAKPHRLWSEDEARGLVDMYNLGLLHEIESEVDLVSQRRRSFDLRLFALPTGISLAARF